MRPVLPPHSIVIWDLFVPREASAARTVVTSPLCHRYTQGTKGTHVIDGRDCYGKRERERAQSTPPHTHTQTTNPNHIANKLDRVCIRKSVQRPAPSARMGDSHVPFAPEHGHMQGSGWSCNRGRTSSRADCWFDAVQAVQNTTPLSATGR